MDSYVFKDFFVLNCVKRTSVKKELSILILKSELQDINAESVQNKLISRFPTINTIESKEISSEYGVEAFVFSGKSIVNEKHENYIYSIHTYKNGFEYNITLSCYSTSVKNDNELSSILEKIEFID